MKKYRVTEKHPALKEGCIIQETIQTVRDSDNNLINLFSLLFNNNTETIFIDHFVDAPVTECIENGWIEEIQEPEFTRDDLFDFGQYVNHNATPGTRYTDEGINSLIENWLKFINRNNENKNKQ